MAMIMIFSLFFNGEFVAGGIDHAKWAADRGAALCTGAQKLLELLGDRLCLVDICKAVPIPVNAIGGLNKGNIDVLSDIPIAGICVVSAIMKAEDPKTAAEALKVRAEELGLC